MVTGAKNTSVSNTDFYSHLNQFKKSQTPADKNCDVVRKTSPDRYSPDNYIKKQ